MSPAGRTGHELVLLKSPSSVLQPWPPSGPNHLHRPLPSLTFQGGRSGTWGALTSGGPLPFPRRLHLGQCRPQASPPPAAFLVPPESGLTVPSEGLLLGSHTGEKLKQPGVTRI